LSNAPLRKYQNSKPADRVAELRRHIAELREEEEALRQGFISGELPRKIENARPNA
jgi:hypothetical protein